MNYALLWILLAAGSNFSWPPLDSLPEILTEYRQSLVQEIPPIVMPLQDISEMLHKETTLSQPVIDKVLKALSCASEYNVNRNNILSVIDFSLPSNQKRLWVFDLQEKKRLYHTYVSHGIKSGTLLTNNFSNKFNSKASSIGLYKTEKSYYGREGLSLRLDGLDRDFNDNASNRSIVMHGGWYVEEAFIKKYGRPGRSWGCPALPLQVYKEVINTIKDNSLLLAYYPNDKWLNKSKFLHCNKMKEEDFSSFYATQTNFANENEQREDVLFANTSVGSIKADDHPIITMSAANYERIFHNKVPLGRMLRRQINNEEYVALSNNEFQRFISDQSDKEKLNTVYFVVPVIKVIRGYYETQMQIVNMGKIKQVRLIGDLSRKQPVNNYVVSFENRPDLYLKSTDRFIRWLGL